MKDLIISLIFVGTFTVGATEMTGYTHYFAGDNPMKGAVETVAQGVEDAKSLRLSLPGGDNSSSIVAVSPVRLQVMYIAHTDGSGVRVREGCYQEAAGSGTLAEGTAVELVLSNSPDCGEWALVRAGAVQSWVRVQYLDAGSSSTSSQESAAPGKETSDKDEERREKSGSPKSEATATPTASGKDSSSDSNKSKTESSSGSDSERKKKQD